MAARITYDSEYPERLAVALSFFRCAVDTFALINSAIGSLVFFGIRIQW